MDIAEAIGNTSIVPLRKLVPADRADAFAKLEWENPTGSVKDRMAQAVISRAETDGRLQPGDAIVEYTSSTGARHRSGVKVQGVGSSRSWSTPAAEHVSTDVHRQG
jgi:Pyridoxal-phosphate dependent enzyme